jgi:hypothetical protein
MIDPVHGTADAKMRLHAFLAALAGEQTVAQACMVLEIGERGYFKLRARFLQAALAWFEPRGPGRPPGVAHSPSDRRVSELETALRDLRVELQAARIREEIALTLPHLVRRSRRVKKAPRRKPHRQLAGAAIPASGQNASANAACASRC